MKIGPIAFVLAALLPIAACSDSTGADHGVEGTYVLTRIDGQTYDGHLARAISGTLTLRGGRYESEYVYSAWSPDDRGTISDRGRYENDAHRVVFTSERHFSAGDATPNGNPYVDIGTFDGRGLTVTGGSWSYYWTRK